MAEILQASYEDPDGPSAGIGLDASELTASRATFDDVDDYDGWLASPPQQRDGTAMQELPGWSRPAYGEIRLLKPLNHDGILRAGTLTDNGEGQ